MAAVHPAVMRTIARTLLGLPEPLLLRLASASRKAQPGVHRAQSSASTDGQQLDAQLALALALHERFGPPPLEHTDPETARVIIQRGFEPFDILPRTMARIDDVQASLTGAESVPVRVYTPVHARSGGPALIYYHGGGGVTGSIAGYDALCRLLADETGYTVISVEYRLAPEHKFPAAVEDAMTAYAWVRHSAARLAVDPERLAVAGDSMGGNLAAVVCQQARRAAMPVPALQVLLYPCVDLDIATRSRELFGRGYLLTNALIHWFRDHYLQDQSQLADVRVSPLRADDLSGLSRALIITAGFDPLRDEARLYADALERAGVAVTYRCERSLVHGFVSMTGIIRAARRAMEQVAAEIREVLR